VAAVRAAARSIGKEAADGGGDKRALSASARMRYEDEELTRSGGW